MAQKPSKNAAGPTDPRGAAARARDRSRALRDEASRRERRRGLLVQAGVIAVVVLVALGVTVAVLSSRDGDGAAAGPPPGVNEQGGIVVGPDSAEVTVTLVEDFQCPACRAFETAAGDLLASYRENEQVALEYRGIAFLDPQSTNRYSSRALNASACVVADSPVAWPEFHQRLFEQQPAEGGPGLDDDTLVAIAAAAGADAPEVATCIRDEAYASWVDSTTEATLGADGVSGTPTVFVNGEVVPSSPEAVDAAVQAALAS